MTKPAAAVEVAIPHTTGSIHGFGEGLEIDRFLLVTVSTSTHANAQLLADPVGKNVCMFGDAPECHGRSKHRCNPATLHPQNYIGFKPGPPIPTSSSMWVSEVRSNRTRNATHTISCPSTMRRRIWLLHLCIHNTPYDLRGKNDTANATEQ